MDNGYMRSFNRLPPYTSYVGGDNRGRIDAGTETDNRISGLDVQLGWIGGG